MILQTKQRKETKLRGSLQKQPNPQALQQAGLVKQTKKKNHNTKFGNINAKKITSNKRQIISLHHGT